LEQIKLSIITIVKNGYEDIEYTMESVLQQRKIDFEYIIKDGMSNDGTVDLINKVRDKYPHQKVKIISSLDNGIYDAMNQAVQYSHGQWIIFINSGDTIYNSNTLEKIFTKEEFFADCGVIYGDAVVRDECGDMIWKADISLIKKKMPFCHQSCFIKRELLLKYPFNTNLKIAADYNNILDLYSCNIQFYYFEDIVSTFKINGVSSKNFLERYKEKIEILSAHGYKNNNLISLWGELLTQYVKTIAMNILPKILLCRFKKIYKIYIKKYTYLSDYN